MAKTYRVGIIGRTGKGDYGHGVDLVWAKLPNVEIVALADDNAAAREAAQKRAGAKKSYADYREMLDKEKLDIVSISQRWIDQHRDMIVAAAEHGCHVYMEKPFCRTLAECDDAVRQLEMRHLKLGIAHVSQQSPVLDVVKALIHGGEIGDVLELRGRGKEDRRGGAEDLWVLGSHVFGLMRSFGGDATSCFATVTQAGRAATKADVAEGAEGIGLLAGDGVDAMYSFASGVKGYFASHKNAGGSPSRFGLQIFGSKGVIEMVSGFIAPAQILKDGGWSPGRSGKKWQIITSDGIDKPEPRKDGTYEGGHIAAIQDLMDAIERDRKTRCGAEDARAITEMIAAVFESHRAGGPVAMPLANRQNPLSTL